jgi:hypothetical protein
MKLEILQKYFKDNDANQVIFSGNCHDCKKDVFVYCDLNDDGEIIITGGAVYQPNLNSEYKKLFYKCNVCYDKNKTLEKYNPCEVYSRIVGYLRPLNQWNKGKQAEWDERVEFKKNIKFN